MNDVDDAYITTASDPFSPSSAYGDKINILYYERDVRKKFDRTMNVVPGCSATAVSFRSKEDIYGIQTLTQLDFGVGVNLLYFPDSHGLLDLEVRYKML